MPFQREWAETPTSPRICGLSPSVALMGTTICQRYDYLQPAGYNNARKYAELCERDDGKAYLMSLQFLAVPRFFSFTCRNISILLTSISQYHIHLLSLVLRREPWVTPGSSGFYIEAKPKHKAAGSRKYLLSKQLGGIGWVRTVLFKTAQNITQTPRDPWCSAPAWRGNLRQIEKRKFQRAFSKRKTVLNSDIALTVSIYFLSKDHI